MAITDKKISTVYSDRDLASLSDRPNEDGLTAAQLKARFDQLPKEVIPQYNALIDELNDTVLPGKSDVGHTHDDRYFTETEVGVLLSGKSDTSHTHDGRYYTETETDALLSGKSDTTHNHDLTYAPIVHNHDDIYYTDDEVDTLLLSKSDTTHTHALNTGTGDLMVSDRQLNVGTVTSNLLAFKTNNTTGGYFGTSGDFSLNQNLYVLPSKAISNANSLNNAKIELQDTGAVITRNVNDANIALKVNQQQGTGRILDLQFGGVSKTYVTIDGDLDTNFVYSPGLANKTASANSTIYAQTTGTLIYRNVADANSALTVNQQNASSTGNIAEFQFNGTTKLAIDKNGLIPQEAWITPTLLNGWVSVNEVGYMKDQFGWVNVRGSINTGTSGTVAFTLPTGYRPSAQFDTIGYDVNAAVGKIISVGTNGNVTIWGTYSGRVYLNQIRFRV